MHKKRNIAVIGAKGFPAWGGAARANEAIFTRLKDHYSITVYAMSSHASIENYNGIKQIIYKSHKNKKISTLVYYIISLFHAIFKGNYDIIHVNHLAAGYIIPFLRLRFPVVLNVRGMNYNGDNKWNSLEKKMLNLFQWLGLNFSNLIITVEMGSIEALKKAGARNIVYIPNGVDNNFKSIQAKERKEYDITFSAARIISLKGLHVLLDALIKMNFKGRIQVIGDLDQIQQYKQEILKQSKDLNCDFVGLVHNKDELFRRITNSKLFVFPSFSEGMSNMLLEVASLKVPIIASDIPQNKDVFSEEEVLFFNLHNPLDLSNKISWALENYDKLETMAEKAYLKLIAEYDWDLISENYHKQYQKLLSIT